MALAILTAAFRTSGHHTAARCLDWTYSAIWHTTGLASTTDARNTYTRVLRRNTRATQKRKQTNNILGSKDERCETNLPLHHHSLLPSHERSTANRRTSTHVLFPRTQCGKHTIKVVSMWEDGGAVSCLSIATGGYLFAACHCYIEYMNIAEW